MTLNVVGCYNEHIVNKQVIMTTKDQPVIAYLLAYTPQGVMEHRTTDFAKVYQFKKTCNKIGCQYAVRFRKVEPTKVDHQHIWNRFRKLVRV